MSREISLPAAPAVCLMGPTAAGKTALAVHLARRLPFDVVSVDSAMVYRGMDIGTGKPGPDVLSEVPHRLVDIRDPREGYSAAEFRADATRALAEIRARGRVPLLVGGTGLYFRALRHGLSRLPPASPAVRRRLDEEAARDGWAALHERLAAVDPAAARRIHPNDAQRIQRALEIYEITGRTMTESLGRDAGPDPGPDSPPALVPLVVAPADRSVLHRAIAERFQRMLEAGFVGEVERLRAGEGMHAGLPAMRAVGYRQIWEHLDGRGDRAAMTERAVAATRQLARRQLTWLRSEAGAAWFDGGSPGLPDRILAHLSDFAVQYGLY